MFGDGFVMEVFEFGVVEDVVVVFWVFLGY